MSQVAEAFTSSKIVPDVVSNAPNAAIQLNYSSGAVASQGNQLTPTQVKDQPSVSFDADPNAYYTLVFVDPDVPSRKTPFLGQLRHWIVGNVPGSNVAAGDVIAQYIGAGPPKFTGLHRYVFLVFQQPEKLHFNERFISKE